MKILTEWKSKSARRQNIEPKYIAYILFLFTGFIPILSNRTFLLFHFKNIEIYIKVIFSFTFLREQTKIKYEPRASKCTE